MKKFKRAAIVAMAIMTAFGGVACGGGENKEVDVNKTQLVIGYKSAGYGNAWVQNAVEMFEKKFANYSFEEGKTGVQVWVNYGKDEFSDWTFYNSYQSRNEDMYINATIWYDMYEDSHIWRLDDLVEEPLTEFGETKSIKDKILPWVERGSRWDQGVWSVGTVSSMFGLTVYDVDLFEEKGYYMAEGGGWTKGTAGDKAKTKGFDGIAGTYDDGLPVTEDEYFSLLNRIKMRGDIPVTWTGINSSYPIAWAWMNYLNYDDGKAQEIWNNGYGEYTLLHKNADGSYSLDDTPTVFDGAKNFYENARVPGKLEALRIAYKLVKDQSNYSTEAYKTTQTHIEAQNEYLTSISAEQRIAMIWEGCWWETEADDTFTRMAKNDASLSKHNRRFGVMPAIKPNGNTATKHTYNISQGGVWIPAKTARKGGGAFEASKKFCKMMGSDEFLNMFTKTTNIPTAYDIEYTQDTYDSLTYFGKQLMEIVQDKNNTHAFTNEFRQFHPAFQYNRSYPQAFSANVHDPNSTADSTSGPLEFFRFDTNNRTPEYYYDCMYKYATMVYDEDFAEKFGARK